MASIVVLSACLVLLCSFSKAHISDYDAFYDLLEALELEREMGNDETTGSPEDTKADLMNGRNKASHPGWFRGDEAGHPGWMRGDAQQTDVFKYGHPAWTRGDETYHPGFPRGDEARHPGWFRDGGEINPQWLRGDETGNPAWLRGDEARNPAWLRGDEAGNPAWFGDEAQQVDVFRHGHPSWTRGHEGNPHWLRGDEAGHPAWMRGDEINHPGWPRKGDEAGHPGFPRGDEKQEKRGKYRSRPGTFRAGRRDESARPNKSFRAGREMADDLNVSKRNAEREKRINMGAMFHAQRKLKKKSRDSQM